MSRLRTFLEALFNPAATRGFLVRWVSTRRYDLLWQVVPAGLVLLLTAAWAVRAHTQADRDGLFDRYARRSEAALRSGALDQAGLCARRMLRLRPRDREATFQLAKVQHANGRVRAAGESLLELAVRDDDLGVRAGQWLVEHAPAALVGPSEPARRAETTRLLTRIVRKDGANLRARTLLGELRRQDGDLKGAIEQWTPVAAGQPRQAMHLARLHVAAGQPEQARAVLTGTAQRLADAMENGAGNEGDPEILRALLLVLQRYPEALRLVRQQRRLKDSAQLRLIESSTLTALARQGLNGVETAQSPLTNLAQAIEVDPSNPAPLLMLATLARTEGAQRAAAAATLERHLASGQSPAIAHVVRGTMALLDKDLAVAEREFRIANDLQPNAPATLNNLAWTLSQMPQGDQSQALALAEQALALDPENARIRDTRGLILVRLGQWERAVPDLERALEQLARDNDTDSMRETHEALAQAYRKLGDSSLAERHAGLAEQMRPSR